jgi:DNA polymerase III subunit epsilon
MDPIATGTETSSLTVRDVVQRHGGEFWFERDRVRHQAFFRFLLPLAPAAARGPTPASCAATAGPSTTTSTCSPQREHHALDDRRLVELAYTVFDTETTGLNPAGGDEIIQIGATRLVNGKLLRSECFDQLVDPQRRIPEAASRSTASRPTWWPASRPSTQVLPAFHALRRTPCWWRTTPPSTCASCSSRRRATGLRFDQPVLDTLLLSAVVHPNQESHRLEAIAERFDITVIGRHTALGDAMVTAEVFQKLIPLLAEKGIHTLGQAREAAQQTYYARLKY